MANTPQARKRVRQNEERRLRNKHHKSRMRTAIKKVEKAVAEGDKQAAESALEPAVSIVDHVAGKGAIHRNTAARTVSRLTRKVQQLS
ncbi:30S ribosomal protein S20 [Thiohalorhabdus denitrificans]|uniref:Small ribosomal subunit protein bS20 n=1 Tax=Thiohalorhabdus denitrificans TaxID=381306 RepID=A0A0N8PN62_9GAMM|nr:30S ribosomal protein S20 [Thiohalorhabdus denitrificans]KPV40637.1 30S ribosomal protein S20 [Thiohalorhabdus denitrificans]SCY48734.1 SSU ribosomal protein S20P [Thiohalorhabdus denitrificans]